MPSDERADMNAMSPNNRNDVRASFMIYVENVAPDEIGRRMEEWGQSQAGS